jgi:hypothetical protein
MAPQASSTRDSTQRDVWWGGATIFREAVVSEGRRVVISVISNRQKNSQTKQDHDYLVNGKSLKMSFFPKQISCDQDELTDDKNPQYCHLRSKPKTKDSQSKNGDHNYMNVDKSHTYSPVKP